MTTRLKLGFLVSHGGSSMRAIVAAIRDGSLDAEALLVVSNNGDSPALEFCRENGIAWRHISARTAGSPDAADRAISSAMRESGVELIVLSGYLRPLGPETLKAYDGRALNIHPALLPSYGGQGMYGRRVHEAVVAAGETVSGATVHLVDAEYDNGAVLAQAQVDLPAGCAPEEVERLVMAAEPWLFVQTLQRISNGELQLPSVRLFSYGTLQQPEVQLANFGRRLTGHADVLPDYRLGSVEIADAAVVAASGAARHPIAVASEGDEIAGMVFELDTRELWAADSYETDAYERRRVRLRSGEDAWAYVEAAPHRLDA